MRWWAAVLLVLPAWAAGFDATERARIASLGPWPPPARLDVSNRVDGRVDAIEFGRRLFGDRRLSADGSLSCADCHRPDRAFQDGLATARGRSMGTRNTPSVADAAFRRWLGWDGGHDSLWSASFAPLVNPCEMGADVVALARRVRSTPDLMSRYRRVFGPKAVDDETLVVNLAKALAAFQATRVTPRTPFDEFRDALLRGDERAMARYPAEAQRGLRLFVGEGRCILCHSGPHFTNGEFADIGIPFFVPGGVDSGRHGGLQRLQASRTTRLGPFSDAPPEHPDAAPTRHVVAEHRHFGEFRVPGLRQLLSTAPYMHDGSLATIEEVVRHYSELNEERLHADGERILRPLRLTPQQAADLAAFLRSLSSMAHADRRRPRSASRRSSFPPRTRLRRSVGGRPPRGAASASELGGSTSVSGRRR